MITTSYSQSIFIGTKSYSSTDEWHFTIHLYNYLNVSICKTSTGGAIMLAAQTITSSNVIQGAIIIYLQNGKAIQAEKYLDKDYVDNRSVVLYFLSMEQIKMLCSSDISTIRYSIVTNPYNDKQGFTARNIGYDLNGLPDASLFTKTSIEIKELFKL